MQEDRKRATRFAVSVPPEFFEEMSARCGPWYETEEEIQAGLKWGRQRERLLRWARLLMNRRLTLRERRCIELHFFKGMSCVDVATATGSDPSSVQRAISRSLRKLRCAAVHGRRIRRYRRVVFTRKTQARPDTSAATCPAEPDHREGA